MTNRIKDRNGLHPSYLFIFFFDVFQTTFSWLSPQSPENQERKSKLTEYEKEKTSKSDRKRVSAGYVLLIMLLAVLYSNYSGQTMVIVTSAIFGNLRSLSESYRTIGKQREHSRVFLLVAKQCLMKITYQVNSLTGFGTEYRYSKIKGGLQVCLLCYCSFVCTVSCMT